MSIASTNLSGQLGKTMRGPSATVWLCVITVWVFIIWAAFAWIDEIVKADGEIIASSRPQIIQNLEGGILANLQVKEGDEVMRGDVLARLHSTQFQSVVDDLQDQITALEVRRLRIEAEMVGAREFTVPANFTARMPDIVASERALLLARQSDYESRKNGAKQVMDQTASELRLMENMLAIEAVALIEVTRARKAQADAQVKYNEVVTQTELTRAQEYSETLKKLAALKQNLTSAQDQLTRTVLRSPMNGVVNKIHVTTIGGVVRPGEEILQIIPLDEELFVESRVRPSDIAHVRYGQEATIKLSAYDYTTYGTLKGRVNFISADTFKDERVREAEQEPHYKVTLSIDMASMRNRQAQIEIRPGMQALVELHTGKKTVLQYLMKPLYKSREALREP